MPTPTWRERTTSWTSGPPHWSRRAGDWQTPRRPSYDDGRPQVAGEPFPGHGRGRRVRCAMPKFAVVLPAAGQSSRFGPGEKKPFATLDGRAVWLRSAELFVNRKDVCQCVVVIAPDDRELFDIRYTANLAFMDVRVAPGGRERFESVANALALVKPEADFIAIHDAVRPCLTAEQIDAVFAAAAKDGAAILAVTVSDTVKRVGAGKKIEETLSR